MVRKTLASTEPVYWYGADKKTPMPREVIQLARTGRFYREDHGGVFRVTKLQLLQMRDNAVDRGVDVPLKYTHSGEVYAAGWLSPESLSVQPIPGGYGLFGKPRWTAAALEQIQKGALKYISPEIVWKDKRLADSKYGSAGEEIGATLVGAALVLSPFFDMLPVSSFSKMALNKEEKGKTKMYDHMLALASAEKMAEVQTLLQDAGVSAEQASGVAAKLLLMMIRSMAEKQETPEVELEEEESEEKEEVSAPMAEAAPMAEEVKEEVKEEEMLSPMSPEMQAGMMQDAELLKSMAKAFGLKTASKKSVLAAVEAQRTMYSAMQTRLSTLEKAEQERQKTASEALFSKYQAEGRFRFCATDADPTGVSAAKDILGKGADVFESVFGNVQPLAAFGKAPSAPKKPVSYGKTAADSIPVEKIHQYQAKHNVNYGEALKALLLGKD